MKVYKLTEEQKNILIGLETSQGNIYNPILDADDNWFISGQEVEQTTDINLNWVHSLPEINYNPKPSPIHG
jgi:hypothetical protein